MCCYKLVTCEFIWWGLQGRVESLIQKVATWTPLRCVFMILLNHRFRASVTGLETDVIDVLSMLRYNYSNVAGINYSWLR